MIEGRSDDVLSLLNSSGEKVLVFPDFIRRAIVFSDENIINYSVTQKEAYQINLFIDGDTIQYGKAIQAILDLFSKFKISNIEISRQTQIDHIKGTKLRRVKNEYKTSN